MFQAARTQHWTSRGLRAAMIDVLERSRVKDAAAAAAAAGFAMKTAHMQFGASLMGNLALASDASPRLREEKDDLPFPKVSESVSESRQTRQSGGRTCTTQAYIVQMMRAPAPGSSPARGATQRHLHAAASKAASTHSPFV